MTDEIRLNMGTAVSPGDGTPYEDVVDIKRYIPEDHRYLVRFLSIDMHAIIDALSKAFACGDRTLVLGAASSICASHRYFEHSGRIYSYINRSLARIIWADNSIGESERKDAFFRLAVFEGGMEKDPSYWLSEEKGKGSIQSLACMQDDLKIMLPVVFDDSNGLAIYPQQVRNGLYGLLMEGSCPRIGLVPGRAVLPFPESMNGLRAAMDFDETFRQSMLHFGKYLKNGGKGVPSEIKKVLDKIPASGEGTGWAEYDTPYLEDVLRLEVSMMVSSGTRLKKCSDCGRYFPVTEDNDMYCNIPDVDGSSCLARHREEEKKEAVKAVYTQAYRTRFARMKKGKETKEELDAWRETARRMQKDVYSGKLSEKEYKERITAGNGGKEKEWE